MQSHREALGKVYFGRLVEAFEEQHSNLDAYLR
jgi:hypothetical protein